MIWMKKNDILFKIFKETNDNVSTFEDEINDFFESKDDAIFLSMNTVMEKVDGIEYMNIIVCYKYD